MARKKRGASMMRRMHRSLGAGVAMFVVFMVVSGLAINHSGTLGLARHHVSSTGLLNWYGIEGPESINSYRVREHWVSFAGSQVFVDDQVITTLADGVGAVQAGPFIIVAGSRELILLDTEGRLVERIGWNGTQQGVIEAIGKSNEDQVVTRSAGQLWVADIDLLGWKPLTDNLSTPQWSLAVSGPDTLQQAIAEHYRGQGLNMERILLDLHSGRIFGRIGVVVYDLLALAVGFLAISGLVFWFRARRNGQANGKS